MKAIILCAGQGRRLLPYTEQTPKCLLELDEKYFIEWQIDTLLASGVEHITAVVGYAADRIVEILGQRYPRDRVSTVFNPFYEVADNLASCWMAREHMQDEFLLINGDTLFESKIIKTVLTRSEIQISVTTDCKSSYDEDDMKIIAQNGRLLRIGKSLPLEEVTGESIGILYFRKLGAEIFSNKIHNMMHEQSALKQWYLSVIDSLAQETLISTTSIEGMQWTEVDFVRDYEQAQELIKHWPDRG